jgi:co-chaperonin GroES (HSP10)
VTIEFHQRLLDDMIAVELIGEPASKGRILLPDWQKFLRGTVIATGPGRMLPFGERAPMECRVGDVVTFSPTAGMESDFGVGRAVRMMRDPDVDTVEVKPGFCRACGASIPHRVGEGRCTECMHYLWEAA